MHVVDVHLLDASLALVLVDQVADVLVDELTLAHRLECLQAPARVRVEAVRLRTHALALLEALVLAPFT